MALHCITWHCITFHCIALHYISLLFIAMHCIALHCLALHCITLHSIALHCIPLHCIAVHCIALPCIALQCIAFHCIELQAFIYGFFRSIYDFFRVHFVFHVGVSGSNSFGFLSVSPTVFKLSLGFYFEFLLRFCRVSCRVSFRDSFRFPFAFNFECYVNFLSENLVKVFKHSCRFLESFFRVSFRISFMRGQKNTGEVKQTRWGIKKNNALVYFDKISCTCAAQPCTCAAQH